MFQISLCSAYPPSSLPNSWIDCTDPDEAAFHTTEPKDHLRWYIVRDVEIKNKSPVSWSCYPPGSRLSASLERRDCNWWGNIWLIFLPPILSCVVIKAFNKYNTRMKHYFLSWTSSWKSLKFYRSLIYLMVLEREISTSCYACQAFWKQHVVLCGLVFQVLPEFSSREVPHLFKLFICWNQTKKRFHLNEPVRAAPAISLQVQCGALHRSLCSGYKGLVSRVQGSITHTSLTPSAMKKIT